MRFSVSFEEEVAQLIRVRAAMEQISASALVAQAALRDLEPHLRALREGEPHGDAVSGDAAASAAIAAPVADSAGSASPSRSVPQDEQQERLNDPAARKVQVTPYPKPGKR